MTKVFVVRVFNERIDDVGYDFAHVCTTLFTCDIALDFYTRNLKKGYEYTIESVSVQKVEHEYDNRIIYFDGYDTNISVVASILEKGLPYAIEYALSSGHFYDGKTDWNMFDSIKRL